MADGGRLTWFPFNPGDWLADDRVAVMGWQLEGAYMHLLCRMWVRGQGGGQCSIPDDDAYIAGVLRASEAEVRKIRSLLIEGPLAVFQKVDGTLVNKRLLREFEEAKALVKSASDAGKSGAAKRWNGGGKGKKAKSKRADRAGDSPPMPVPLPTDDDAMRSLQGSDGNLQIQAQVTVQEDSVPVETTCPSDPTVGAAGADDEDAAEREQLDLENGIDAQPDLDSIPDEPPPPPAPDALARSTPDPRGTRIPEDFALTPTREERARVLSLPADIVRDTFDEFVAYWANLPGKAGRKLNWDLTWDNNCRRVVGILRARGAYRGAVAGQRAATSLRLAAADQTEANFDAAVEARRGT